MKLLSIIFLIAVASGIQTTASEPTRTSQRSDLKIAYNVHLGNDNYEIFVMNLDGTEAKNITNLPSIEWVYYAYQNKLYFVSDRDSTKRKYFLYEMDADGGNVRKISNFVVADSWVSSRKKATEFVVSSAKDGKRFELYLIDRNGQEIKRLTNDDIYDNDPAFSPNGKQIVFRSKRSGLDELWVMDEQGGNLRQLTHYPKDEPEDKNAYHASAPFWEPNRNVISYASKQKGKYSIFTIKPDGSGLKQITSGKQDAMWHSWSPDGNWLAYDGTDEQGNYDIYLMRFGGGEARRLTSDKRTEMAPVFVKANRK